MPKWLWDTFAVIGMITCLIITICILVKGTINR